MTPNEIKKFFEVYPDAVIYKADKRYFLAKDKGLADDYAKTKEVEVEVITAKSKLDTNSKADEAAKKAAEEAAKKAADEEAAKKAAEGSSSEPDKK